jgi:hypothetical protein
VQDYVRKPFALFVHTLLSPTKQASMVGRGWPLLLTFRERESRHSTGPILQEISGGSAGRLEQLTTRERPLG